MKLLAAAALLAGAAVGPAFADASPCRQDRALFIGGAQPIEIGIEIADDPTERAQGLMFRKSLPAGRGMLFVYEHPQPVAFWMRNTLIPLDMIFIDAKGEVRHVHPNARPLDETSIPGAMIGDPAPDRLFVLEVPGGDAERLGIRPGLALAHPAVPAASALVNCSQ